MKILETNFKDLYVIEPSVFGDDRGYFFESFNQKKFEDLTKLTVNFVQDNQSQSAYGTLRGLHFQAGDHAQAKLVRVLSGKVLDVVVDLRETSETYKQAYSIELSAENKKQLFVPRGFAHGFVVLSDSAEFFYKVDNYYCKEAEGGIVYNDPTLKIDWKMSENKIILSEKDKILPRL